ncbi:LuxR C-terminal-related transcriptional regulator [Bacillus sp. 3255]|uniref:LuxR C-terminal-related transcriptional regulator n=1 Tax=Bacillus sp. 3255 TaxID=2817904 RepID=UPI0028578D70|nr:LuxR C-terminal-related transcriptional regulator [Bacillus sp. 3255]MDR6883988.1 DNA-binding CsgD family transcriptional regulator [Bacillus sp. 3255]
MIDERYEEESEWLVGRKREIDEFLQLLEASPKPYKILNVFGTAGIGKSSLLDEFQRLARAGGTWTLSIDSEGDVKTPEALCEHILRLLPAGTAGRATETTDLPVTCLQALNQLASERQVVLFIDVYEQMESMDQWLRDYFLKKLDNNILTVIAGRHSLSEAWHLSPVWRRQLTRMALSELDYTAVARFAENTYITDEKTIGRIWRYSKGHPLTLSLITFLFSQPDYEDRAEHPGGDESLPYLISQWLREVPGEHLRPYIEAACVLRHFNQESLSFVTEREITASEFYQLIRFSFIRRVDRGYTVHSLMRDAVARELLSRTPSHYEKVRVRALQYYYKRLTDGSKTAPDRREGFELMYYIGDSLIRAFMNWFELSPRHYETVGSHHLAELEAYVAKRKATAKDTRIELYDPQTNGHFNFNLTAQEASFTVHKLDFKALFSLGYDVVRAMRDADDSIIGIAVVIPIHRDTLPYLRKAPRSSVYFNSLSPEMNERLSVPAHTRAGWFIETIDTADYADASQQAAIGHLLHALIFTGELLVESPAPIPYFIQTHLSLGFEIAPNGRHTNYDGETPTDTFILDMQNEQVVAYIHRMLALTGQQMLLQQEAAATLQQIPPAVQEEAAAALDRISLRTDITSREKEVAKLLEAGFTNKEIAATLYISEVTVKKHMKSMFAKLDAVNRTQLLKKLLE